MSTEPDTAIISASALAAGDSAAPAAPPDTSAPPAAQPAGAERPAEDFTFWWYDPGSGNLPAEVQAMRLSEAASEDPMAAVISSAPTVELGLGTIASISTEHAPTAGDDHRFESLREHLGRIERLLEERVGACEAGLSEVAGVLATLQADDEQRDEQRRNREALYEKLQASRSTFLFQLVQPLIQRLASLYDLIGDFVNTPPRDVEAWSQTLAMLRRHIEQTLQGQGIEPLRPAEGQEFDSRHHHIIATRPTADPAAGGRIAEVVQAGFLQFSQNERSGETKTTVVRPAKVITWKFSEELAAQSAAASPTGDGG